MTPSRPRILLQVLGAACVGFAAVFMAFDVFHSFHVETHSAENGHSDILAGFHIGHFTLLFAFVGALLLAVSFIPARRARDSHQI
jgi:hypothetical protein